MPFMLRDNNSIATKVSKKIQGIPAPQQHCDDKKRISEYEKNLSKGKPISSLFKDIE